MPIRHTTSPGADQGTYGLFTDNSLLDSDDWSRPLSACVKQSRLAHNPEVAASCKELRRQASNQDARQRVGPPPGDSAAGFLKCGPMRSEEHTSELQSPMHLV